VADDYTPTMNTVRAGWSNGHPFRATTSTEERLAEFDRALAAHDREVAEKAWDEAIALACHRFGVQGARWDNPYREV